MSSEQGRRRGRGASALAGGGGLLAVLQLLHHQLGVAHAAGQLLAAAKLLQQRQLVGAELSLLVDVGDGAHQRAQDQLGVVLPENGGGNLKMVGEEKKRRVLEPGVVPPPPPPTHLEEVDLHGAVGEVQDDGALGAEPQGEVGETRQLVAVPPRHVGAGLQQVLAHVVAEVFQQRDLEKKRGGQHPRRA